MKIAPLPVSGRKKDNYSFFPWEISRIYLDLDPRYLHFHAGKKICFSNVYKAIKNGTFKGHVIIGERWCSSIVCNRSLFTILPKRKMNFRKNESFI